MCGAEVFALPEGVQRVARYLQDANHPHTPQMLDGAARTSQEAAEQLGIAVGQVAKSVVFRHKPSGGHVLVIAAGDRRVDEKRWRHWSARQAAPMQSLSKHRPAFRLAASALWHTCMPPSR